MLRRPCCYGARGILCDHKLRIPLSLFAVVDVSFTYPDSLYKVPLDDLGRVNLGRDPAPAVYRLEELEELIGRHMV